MELALPLQSCTSCLLLYLAIDTWVVSLGAHLGIDQGWGSRRVLDPHPIGVGSACLAHHPTSGSYRLNKGLGAGLATIALAGVGAGVGIVFGSLIHSVSRNPTLSKQLFGYAILGFALSEAMALFALLVAFVILFGLPILGG